ncbi:glycerate kinase [Actinotignum timonense]|uniref:glycerate kinase n=1 Tax=Actinotignum timonense TaxID=1870995 RepID=UPI002A7EE518|nr:glycerate kinase [Actinotignum timonense]MDY5139056.1 glycerate kinase [Actinotignum timonense]
MPRKATRISRGLTRSRQEAMRLARADFSGLDPRLAGVTIRVACDVDNPLLGERGASAIYGPQKGASPEDVEFLDRVLRNFATVAGKMDVQETPGAGAAGGLGFAFLLLGASLESGVDLVMETVGLAEAMAGADLVLTGEGAMDRQTLMGKTLSGVARLAAAAGAGAHTGVPIIAFAGKLGEGVEDLYEHGFVGLVPIVDRPCTLDEALAEGAANLENAAERALRLYAAGQRA